MQLNGINPIIVENSIKICDKNVKLNAQKT